MKKVLLLILCFSPIWCSGQLFKNLTLQGEIGTNLKAANGIGVAKPNVREIFSPPVFGIELGHRRLRFSLFCRKMLHLHIMPFDDFDAIPIFQYIEENHFGVGYRFYLFQKKLDSRVQLSHYYGRHYNILNPFSDKTYQGVAIYGGFRIDSWLDIGYRFNSTPSISIISRDDRHALHFSYRFGPDPAKNLLGKDTASKTSKPLRIYALLGMRTFPVTYPKQYGYNFNWVGLSGQVGLEFFVTKYKLSLNLERDWWVRFAGGNPNRSIQSHISTTYIPLKYHHLLKSGNSIKYGLGPCLIIDYLQRKETRKRITAGTEDFGLFFYNVKGMAASVSIPMYKNFDLDVRQVIAFNGEKAFRWMRFSVGGVYRFRPGNAGRP